MKALNACAAFPSCAFSNSVAFGFVSSSSSTWEFCISMLPVDCCSSMRFVGGKKLCVWRTELEVVPGRVDSNIARPTILRPGQVVQQQGDLGGSSAVSMGDYGLMRCSNIRYNVVNNCQTHTSSVTSAGSTLTIFLTAFFSSPFFTILPAPVPASLSIAFRTAS